jgi:hypothetical protein
MSRYRKGRRRAPGSTAGVSPVGRISEQYQPPAPRQLPELRGQLADWLSAEGENFYLVMALAGRQWLPPGQTLAAGAAYVARGHRRHGDQGSRSAPGGPAVAHVSRAAAASGYCQT